MKKKISLGMILILCFVIFTGCKNDSYVGTWTVTKYDDNGEKDYQSDFGFKWILTLNADGSYHVEKVTVDEKKCSERTCNNWNQRWEKNNTNPRWKVIDSKKTGRTGIAFWEEGEEEEPDENDRISFYINDEGCLTDDTKCYER